MAQYDLLRGGRMSVIGGGADIATPFGQCDD